MTILLKQKCMIRFIIIMLITFVGLFAVLPTQGAENKQKLFISQNTLSGDYTYIADAINRELKIAVYDQLFTRYHIITNEELRIVHGIDADSFGDDLSEESLHEKAKSLGDGNFIYQDILKAEDGYAVILKLASVKKLSEEESQVVITSEKEFMLSSDPTDEDIRSLAASFLSVSQSLQEAENGVAIPELILISQIEIREALEAIFNSESFAQISERDSIDIRFTVNKALDFIDLKKYEKARDEYTRILALCMEVTRKGDNEACKKIQTLVPEMKKNSYITEFNNLISSLDEDIIEGNQDLDDVIEHESGYVAVQKIFSSLPIEYQELKNAFNDALKIRFSYISGIVSRLLKAEGDRHFNSYSYAEAKEYYDRAMVYARKSGDSILITQMSSKSERAFRIGKNFLENRVRSNFYIIVFYANMENLETAEEYAYQSKELLENSIFTDTMVINRYIADIKAVFQDVTVFSISKRYIAGIRFNNVAPGTFLMGSIAVQTETDEKPQHEVTLNGFWMSQHEITQKQFMDVMGYNPSSFTGDFLPVENVDFFDAVEFCNELSKQYGYSPFYTLYKGDITPDGVKNWSVKYNWGANGFRLPTEAEWEYACRAGSTTPYFWGDDVDGDYCWYKGNSGDETTEVGESDPNEWGFHDMIGNVWEWCMVYYGSDYYTQKIQSNPTGPGAGDKYVLRGGSWFNRAYLLRSSYRHMLFPSTKKSNIGFRIVLSAE